VDTLVVMVATNRNLQTCRYPSWIDRCLCVCI